MIRMKEERRKKGDNYFPFKHDDDYKRESRVREFSLYELPRCSCHIRKR
jgi:hypothetical protein